MLRCKWTGEAPTRFLSAQAGKWHAVMSALFSRSKQVTWLKSRSRGGEIDSLKRMICKVRVPRYMDDEDLGCYCNTPWKREGPET